MKSRQGLLLIGCFIVKTDPLQQSRTKSKKAKTRKSSVLNLLVKFDQSVRETYSHVDELALVGVDEVGVGCLAGPVVAAATILPPIVARTKLARNFSKLNDSKKLTHDTRKELANLIREHAHYSIAWASVEEIDEMNILQAGLLAMKRAIVGLMDKLFEAQPNIVVLVDGNKKIPAAEYEQYCIIKGDTQSASIAAASVVAKVFRDEWMEKLSQEFPQYMWQSNKGYGSLAHRRAIAEHGLSLWHRRTFTKEMVSRNFEDL